MVVTNPSSRHLLSNVSLQIENAVITPSNTVRNLGVEFDSTMKMDHQVSSLCRSLHFHLCNLGRIRRYIDKTTCEQAVRAVVTSRLDYANALLQGISSSDVQRLQRVQNRAAKLIHRRGKYEHVTPLLHQLHWLPVHQRIVFKILTTVYKCLHNSAPSYLTTLIDVYHPRRSGLRSGSDTTLVLGVPKVHYSIGERGFYAHAPRLWNSLPKELRSEQTLQGFKNSLKTFLFNR